jgi:hypothetical protein
MCYRLQEDCRFNPTISLKNEIVAQGLMNTMYHIRVIPDTHALGYPPM